MNHCASDPLTLFRYTQNDFSFFRIKHLGYCASSTIPMNIMICHEKSMFIQK